MILSFNKFHVHQRKKQAFEAELELTSPHLLQSQFHERVMHIVSELHIICVKSEQWKSQFSIVNTRNAG